MIIPIANPTLTCFSEWCFLKCNASCTTITSRTYEIAAAIEAKPSCRATPAASAPTSDACALGIPPAVQNADIFLLRIILTAWHMSHAMRMLSKMFICLESKTYNKNLSDTPAGNRTRTTSLGSSDHATRPLAFNPKL